MINNSKPRLIPVEFENINSMKENLSEILSDNCDYLVKFKKRWYGGRFEKFIHGWIFNGVYAHGCELGIEGWEKIYKIEG